MIVYNFTRHSGHEYSNSVGLNSMTFSLNSYNNICPAKSIIIHVSYVDNSQKHSRMASVRIR